MLAPKMQYIISYYSGNIAKSFLILYKFMRKMVVVFKESDN